jgi:predicted ATPase
VLVGERGNYRLEKAPTELHISPTVQGVLTARIDRLAPAEKAFLHQLAVIGRQFPLSLVRKVVPQPEEELYRLLSSLQSKEFLYEQPTFPEPDYIFKHALTQEVAYGTVLQDKRKALHERTAQAIESLFHDKLEDHYTELAHHYSRSGNTQRAVKYLHLAGQQAAQRFANEEAIHHLTTALELLQALPDTLERARQELLLQTSLGPVWMFTKGWGGPEVEQIYTRARELCQQVGDTPQLFRVLWGLWMFYAVRSESQVAQELAEQLLRLAQSAQNPLFLLPAYFALGWTLLWRGEGTVGLAHLEQGIALYDPQEHRFLGSVYGQHPTVSSLGSRALALGLLGYPDQALKGSQETLALAQDVAHPNSLSYALCIAAVLHLFRREGKAAQGQAEAVIALSEEHGFPQWLASGIACRGAALSAQGQEEEGITQIRQGLAALQAAGANFTVPQFLALLAEAYGKAGQPEEGLTALTEALNFVDKTGERLYEAELYRLKGTLTLQSRASLAQVQDKSETSQDKSEVPNTQHPTPSTQEAEACFLKAIEIARKQQAKSLELRAVMSLVRLRQQQAMQHASRTTQHEARTMLDAARNMLSEIYHWFTEGFDTKDLQEAKALLEELA